MNNSEGPTTGLGRSGTEAQMSRRPAPAESGKSAGLGDMSFQSESCVLVPAHWVISETSLNVFEGSIALAIKQGKYSQK